MGTLKDYVHKLRSRAVRYLERHNPGLGRPGKLVEDDTVYAEALPCGRYVSGEQRYIAIAEDLPPPYQQQSIEQIIQEGIREGDHTDNTAFRILAQQDMDAACLQAMDMQKDRERQAILNRSRQIWQRRQEMKTLLMLNLGVQHRISELTRLFRTYLTDDQIGYGFGSNELLYAQAFSLIEDYRDRSKSPVVLDIGAGCGTLLHLLRTYGLKGIGLEPQTHLCRRGMTIGLDVRAGSIFDPPKEIRGKTYPVTVSTAVLDVLDHELKYNSREDLFHDFFSSVASVTQSGGISIHVYRESFLDQDGYQTRKMAEASGLFCMVLHAPQLESYFSHLILSRT